MVNNSAIQRCEQLTEYEIWHKPSFLVWKTERFVGNPSFYPVYRYQDYYSYSFIELVKLKGRIAVDRKLIDLSNSHQFLYAPPGLSVDADIQRVGGPLDIKRCLRSVADLVPLVACAIRDDIRLVERENQDFTNIVLCGGKDSLNLLLVPWQLKTLVASASPNYSLVKQFLIDNALPYDLIELNNDDDPDLAREVTFNSCRLNLAHCRWTTQLVELAKFYNNKVIFWLGQHGDVFYSPKWMEYAKYGNLTHCKSLWHLYELCGKPFQWKLKKWLGIGHPTQEQFFSALWNRGAHWQGTHMSLLRELTGALVVSGYHGPMVRHLLTITDFASCIRQDIRPLIGKYLAGHDVIYPSENPSPPVSAKRASIRNGDLFLDQLRQMGIAIEDSSYTATISSR